VVAAVINSGRTNEIKNYSERIFAYILAFRYCSKDQPNHAITVVGQTENQDWIIRNSWG
jgi:C1A family cysteine protease